MLTRYDELFCHQAVSTFDRPASSAREWTERSWLAAYDTAGRFHLATGFGYYPNRNVIDAFACLAVDGRTQVTVRASRELRPEIDRIEVGPFSYQVVEPLRTVRFSLGENDYGLSFDVEAQGITPAHEEGTQREIRRGRVKEEIKRMVQPARVGGWIRTEGETHRLVPEEWPGVRDRSWGIRVAGAELLETGVQPPELPPGMLYTWACMQFPGWALTYHLRERWDDDLGAARPWHTSGAVLHPFGSGREPVELVGIEHDFEISAEDPGRRRLESGRVLLTAIDGSKREVSIRPMTLNYMGVGGYGTFFRGFIHGLWMGHSWMDGHVLDLRDPEEAREAWGGYRSYGAEFRCGDDIGHGTTDLIVIGRYPPYGFQE